MPIAQTDRTLPANRLIFAVRRDMALYRRFRQNLDAVMAEYGLSQPEQEALRNLDLKKLGELGMHPYFLPQITRLFHGSAYNHNDSEAAQAFARSIIHPKS